MYRRSPGLQRGSEEDRLYKREGPSSKPLSPCVLGREGHEGDTYAGSDIQEKRKACVSELDALCSRNADILCRIAVKLGDASVIGLLDVVHSTKFGLNLSRGQLS